MNPIDQLSPVERIRLSVVRAQAALVLGDRDELRRFLDEMREMDVPETDFGKASLQEPIDVSQNQLKTVLGQEKRKNEAEPPDMHSQAEPGNERQTFFTYDDVLAYVKERLAAGISQSQISRETKERFGDLGVAQRTVCYWQKKWAASGEVPAMKRRMRVLGLTSDEVVFIQRLLEQGVNPSEIARRMAEKFGPDRALDRSTIYKYRKQWQIEAAPEDRLESLSHKEKPLYPPSLKGEKSLDPGSRSGVTDHPPLSKGGPRGISGQRRHPCR